MGVVCRGGERLTTGVEEKRRLVEGVAEEEKEVNARKALGLKSEGGIAPSGKAMPGCRRDGCLGVVVVDGSDGG